MSWNVKNIDPPSLTRPLSIIQYSDLCWTPLWLFKHLSFLIDFDILGPQGAENWNGLFLQSKASKTKKPLQKKHPKRCLCQYYKYFFSLLNKLEKLISSWFSGAFLISNEGRGRELFVIDGKISLLKKDTMKSERDGYTIFL